MMFNFFKKHNDKRQNLIKNILYAINDYKPYTYVQIGMSRKNYNLLTNNYFDIVGCKFEHPFFNTGVDVCIASFSFYKILGFKVPKNIKNNIFMIRNKQYEILTDNEFIIKSIIE